MAQPCKKCLLAELAATDFTEHLLAYIRSVPEESRVDEATYQRRLAQCRACGSLVSGICTQCGCFAELRALRPEQRCAAPERKW
ncbi:MAG: hypothetical protein IJ060_03600 [Oscillospiraceae bacterium]|nr:hypothetical protein [Oscillospiraceae bacterium]